MKPLRFFLLLFVLLVTPAAAQDPAAVWNSLAQPAFDGAKTASVQNLALVRDRIRITLVRGSIQFSQPVAGRVFGASFAGQGRIQIEPPNALERQQLRLHTGQETLDMEFSEAAFGFSDGTYDEIARQVQWTPGAAAAQLYEDRQREREDVGAELLPRLFKSLLSADPARTALFFADLNTKDKGWVHVRFDALEPEEITVGRWRNWGGGIGFDNWLSFPAGNRSAAEAFRDPLAKEDFLFRGYRISATVTDGAELSATSQVRIELRASGEHVLVFTLDAKLRVESVKDDKGAALGFFQPRDPKERNQSYGDYVAVVLPEPTRAGQPLALEFTYSGKRVVRKMGSGNYFCQSFGWYPTRPNSFAARTDFELIFRTPKKYTLVATGNKVDSTVEGDWAISTWKSDLPLAVAGFAYGDYKVTTEKAGAIDVEIYANKEPDDFMKGFLASVDQMITGEGTPKAHDLTVGNLNPSALTKTMATEVANTVRLFEKYFGPYPYKHLAVTNIPYSYGQGWPGLLYLSVLSFMDSTQRQAVGIGAHVLLTDFFRAHESSHQWWGHRVGWKSYHDQWLSEGFAQFSGNLYVQVRKSQKEYLERLRQDRRELGIGDLKSRPFESLGPIWMGTRLASADAPRGYSVVVYNKGGYVLHMVRMMLYNARSQNPEERFIAMMQEFCQTYHNQAASTEDFKLVVEKYMNPTMDLDGNRRMDWFFRQYVYGTGIPQYIFRYSVAPAADGKFKVTGNVIRSGVPAGWKDILPVYLDTGDRVVRIGWITAVDENTPFELLLPSKPSKLTLNENEDILADIKQ